MRHLIAYVVWIVFFCALLTFGGYILDLFNPKPSEYQSYFDMQLALIGLPTWIQNILLLILVNGIAALRIAPVRVLFERDVRVFIFPVSVIGINFVTVALLLFGFVVFRAIFV